MPSPHGPETEPLASLAEHGGTRSAAAVSSFRFATIYPWRVLALFAYTSAVTPLIRGEPLRSIAERLGLSATALHRHKNAHLPKALAMALEGFGSTIGSHNPSVNGTGENSLEGQGPRCSTIAAKGVQTGADYAIEKWQADVLALCWAPPDWARRGEASSISETITALAWRNVADFNLVSVAYRGLFSTCIFEFGALEYFQVVQQY